MRRPDPELDMDRDWKTLYRINTYLHHEFNRIGFLDNPFLFLYNWKAYRRWRKLDIALDVLHALSRELQAQGQLSSPTMFTPSRRDSPEALRTDVDQAVP